MGTNTGQVWIVFADYSDTCFQSVSKNLQRIFEILFQIDFLDGRLVHVGIALDRGNQIADAAGAVVEFLFQSKKRYQYPAPVPPPAPPNPPPPRPPLLPPLPPFSCLPPHPRQ